jgi:hypothetical protein
MRLDFHSMTKIAFERAVDHVKILDLKVIAF